MLTGVDAPLSFRPALKQIGQRSADGALQRTIARDAGDAGGGGMEGPYLEELLREQSVHVYTYDDHDCRIKSESYEPGMKVTRTAEARCFDGTATPQLTTARDARHIKQVETRHTANGGIRTDLHFDSDGEKVIAIIGDTPTNVDLMHGWGEEVSGFASGIAANREKALQEDLNISVTIKNVTATLCLAAQTVISVRP